jgi:hypothetical protein
MKLVGTRTKIQGNYLGREYKHIKAATLRVTANITPPWGSGATWCKLSGEEVENWCEAE